jgi:hypothetical protein
MRCQPAYKGRLAGWHVGQQEGGTGLLHPKRLARTHSHGFRTPAVRAAYRTYSPFWYLPGGGKFRQIPCSHPARPSRLPPPSTLPGPSPPYCCPWFRRRDRPYRHFRPLDFVLSLYGLYPGPGKGPHWSGVGGGGGGLGGCPGAVFGWKYLPLAPNQWLVLVISVCS